MKSLWSREGRNALHALKSQKALYAFDYDGTLVPITKDPDAPHFSPQVEKLLVEMSEQFPTAVVSGRSVLDLKTRIPNSKNLLLIGNHGLEGPGTDPKVLSRARTVTKTWIRALKDLRKHPVIIEDKKFSISIHERGEDQEETQRQILSFVEELSPAPRIIGGKRIFNLMPTAKLDKGLALARVLRTQKFRAALYVGDDVTDEDVFRRSRKGLITVRVGRKSDSQAQFFIEEQSQIEKLLQFLLT